MTVVGSSSEVARLYRSGHCTYELWRGREVVGHVGRRGVVRSGFDVEVAHVLLSSQRRWPGSIEVRSGGRTLARAGNIARSHVHVDLDGRPSLELVRTGWDGRWVLPSAELGSVVSFVPHPRWPGRPVATVHATDRAAPERDPQTVGLGLCLVLHYRLLTAGLVPGPSLLPLGYSGPEPHWTRSG